MVHLGGAPSCVPEPWSPPPPPTTTTNRPANWARPLTHVPHRQIYCTVDTGTELRVLLPEKERGSFVKALMRDMDALMKAVCKVDVERARAFDPADQRNIFEAVRSTCGVHALNVAAAGGLRDALVQAGTQVLESMTGVAACRLAKQLGWLFRGLGRYAEARRLLERALEGWERELGPDHQDTLVALSDLACVARAQGELTEARRLQERALAAKERTLGPDHGSTLDSVNNLAVVLESQGKYWRARRL